MSDQLKRLLIEYGCHDIESVREIVVPDCALSFAQIRDSLYLLGNILYEDQENSVYVAKIRSGFCNMNAAVVAMRLSGARFEAVAYAKEGRIFQGISERALERVADAARGNPVPSNKPKWMFSSLIALVIIVAVLSIGRNSLFLEKPQIGSQIGKGHNDSGSITGKQDSSDSQGESLSEEEIAFRTEVELTLDATKAYNNAVEAFNRNVTEYNEVVTLTSVANIEGMPPYLEMLTLVSEAYDDIAAIVSEGNNSKEKIAADTETVLAMSEQVKAMTMIVKQITCPSGEWVEERLSSVTTITGTQAVTDELNPDGLLGKEGGYTSCIYFTVAAALPSEVPGGSIVEKGTDAGGAVEIYSTLADAEARVEYLAGFDGTILYSGSYAIVGTMVIRTSYKLTNEQQIELTSVITAALTTI